MLIVDDFVGLALAVGADGVHVGQEDIPVEAIKAIAPKDFIVGVSTHKPEHAQRAVESGADVYKRQLSYSLNKSVFRECRHL